MDKATLSRIMRLCEFEIVNICGGSYNSNGDIDEEAKSKIKERVVIINKMDEIMDNLREDENYYD